MSSLAHKLRILEGTRALVISGPKAVMPKLKALPAGARISTRGRGPFPVVLAFVMRRREVGTAFRRARAALSAGGVLWLAYPKKSSGLKTDVSRDEGWDALADRGWVPVSQIAVDETWSALRFKHDPALGTARSARREARRAESPTVKLKPSDEKKKAVELDT